MTYVYFITFRYLLSIFRLKLYRSSAEMADYNVKNKAKKCSKTIVIGNDVGLFKPSKDQYECKFP